MAEKVAEDSCTYVQQVMDVLNRVEQDQKDLDEGKHEEKKNSFERIKLQNFSEKMNSGCGNYSGGKFGNIITEDFSNFRSEK